MWFVFALGSAVFAALTSILAKIGIQGVNSTPWPPPSARWWCWS